MIKIKIDSAKFLEFLEDWKRYYPSNLTFYEFLEQMDDLLDESPDLFIGYVYAPKGTSRSVLIDAIRNEIEELSDSAMMCHHSDIQECIDRKK